MGACETATIVFAGGSSVEVVARAGGKDLRDEAMRGREWVGAETPNGAEVLVNMRNVALVRLPRAWDGKDRECEIYNLS
jgi:hypothetical protein